MMRKFLTILFSGVLLATSFIAFTSTSANASPTLVTCTDLERQKTIALKATQKNCKPFHAPAIWKVQEQDSSVNVGASYATLRVCTSKNPNFTYQYLKKSCPKFQVTTDYRRAITAPSVPEILGASARGHDGALLTISTTGKDISSPIAYYLVTNPKTGDIKKVQENYQGELSISGLSALSSYSFQVIAVSADGVSSASNISQSITTGATPVIRSTGNTPTLAAPSFSLSSNAETKTVNNAITGYTITSTGGSIASYSISPAAPAGLTFSTSTGLLSGTPTSVASATAYTITATNASGSATRTFTLTVTGIVYTVGSTGPGGGKIFYFSADGFTCGDSYSSTCTYLEVGPSVSVRRLNWSNTALQNTSTLNSTGTAIGTGHRNTAVVVAAGAIESTTSAIAYTDQYVAPNGTNDWFLPSTGEMTALYNAASASGVSLIPGSSYWTSSQSATTANLALQLNTTAGSIIEDYKPNRDALIAPIRAG
jgi:hypothetical protein